MKFLSALFLSLVLTSCSMDVPSHQNFAAMRATTWQLTGEVGSCSAVMVAPKVMLTAAHCRGVGEHLKVDGRDAVVLKIDESVDLMLLFVNMDAPVAKVAKRVPATDARLILVGFPLGIGQFLTEGRMQGKVITPLLPSFLMAASIPSSFGNSGGPAFVLEDGEMKVAGIASAGAFGYGLSTHMIFLVSTDAINAFLK